MDCNPNRVVLKEKYKPLVTCAFYTYIVDMKTFKTVDLIQSWLDKYAIANYAINRDYSVNVYCDVDLSHQNLKSLPVAFHYIYGNFNISHNQLNQLWGCPREIEGDLDCSFNLLTSLEYASTYITGSLYAFGNPLVSLEDIIYDIALRGFFECNPITGYERYFVGDKMSLTPQQIIFLKLKHCGLR